MINYTNLERYTSNMEKVNFMVEGHRVTLNLVDNSLSIHLERNTYIDQVTLYDLYLVIKKAEVTKVTESEFFGCTLTLEKVTVADLIYLM